MVFGESGVGVWVLATFRPVLRVASGQEVAADKLLSGLIPGKTYGPKRVVGDDIAHDEGFGDIG